MGMVTTTLDLPYDRARRKIRDGDLLLFRRQRGRLGGKLISTAGRSEYDHAAMAAWWNRRLMCLETMQGCGGHALLLSTVVHDTPGRIDVYRANATCRASIAWRPSTR